MAAILMAGLPVLGARDMATAVQRYVERLGLTCTFNEGGAPIWHAGISRDGVELYLQWQDERHFPAPSDGAPGYRFLVDDPDALRAECTGRRGPSLTASPCDTPWGTREFRVAAPNGHGIHFYKPLS
jgi:catechol 2,3-dioxygenase-like lactoylglutathione lyase family enzyme